MHSQGSLRFQHSQVGAGLGVCAWGEHPGACPPVLRLSGPLSPRMSATATWAVLTPTSTSRPMVLKDSLSGAGEMGRGGAGGGGEQVPREAEGPWPFSPLCSGRGCYH